MIFLARVMRLMSPLAGGFPLDIFSQLPLYHVITAAPPTLKLGQPTYFRSTDRFQYSIGTRADTIGAAEGSGLARETTLAKHPTTSLRLYSISRNQAQDLISESGCTSCHSLESCRRQQMASCRPGDSSCQLCHDSTVEAPEYFIASCGGKNVKSYLLYSPSPHQPF